MKTKMTTIRVSIEVRDKLKALKLHPRETYNDVIKRLINNWYEIHIE